MELRLEELDENPEIASARITLHSGEEALLRLLRQDDQSLLGAYFLELSEQTRRMYGPHPFDQETADRVCADVDSTRYLRMLALVEREGNEQIIAYFIVYFGIYESDEKRYLERGIPLDKSTDCELAPSVADADQSSGVGSQVMEHLVPLLRRAGKKRIALVGGVRQENVRAIGFYEKFGFRKEGEFATKVSNFDMIAEL